MLDYNGVVGIWDQEKFTENIARVYSISYETASKILYDEEKFYDYERNIISIKELHDFLCEKSGKIIPIEKFDETVLGTYEDNLEMISFLKKLKNKVILALAQGAGEAEVKWQIEHLESVKLMDFNFTSTEYGMYKTEPEFYEKCLKKLNVKADEVLFFEDKQKYIDGANKVGLNAFLFTGVDNFKKIVQEQLEKVK